MVDSVNVSAAVAEGKVAYNLVLVVLGKEGEGVTNENPVATPILHKLVLLSNSPSKPH